MSKALVGLGVSPEVVERIGAEYRASRKGDDDPEIDRSTRVLVIPWNDGYLQMTPVMPVGQAEEIHERISVVEAEHDWVPHLTYSFGSGKSVNAGVPAIETGGRRRILSGFPPDPPSGDLKSAAATAARTGSVMRRPDAKLVAMVGELLKADTTESRRHRQLHEILVAAAVRIMPLPDTFDAMCAAGLDAAALGPAEREFFDPAIGWSRMVAERRLELCESFRKKLARALGRDLDGADLRRTVHDAFEESVRHGTSLQAPGVRKRLATKGRKA